MTTPLSLLHINIHPLNRNSLDEGTPSQPPWLFSAGAVLGSPWVFFDAEAQYLGSYG